MLDITLLRKDLPFVVSRLEARKTSQSFLDVSAFTALEAERYALTDWHMQTGAPMLGQHNRDVFCGLLGIDEAELTQLRDGGVV